MTTLGRQNTDAQQSNQGQGADLTKHQLVGIAGASNKVAGIHLADRPTGEPPTPQTPRSFDFASIEDYMDRLHELKNDLCGAACGIARTVKNWGYDKDVVAVAIDRLIEEAEKYERGLVELTTKGGL